jgi:hypothetical protein
MMEQFYQSGNVAFLILAIMAAEALYFARHARRFPFMLTGLVAGACIVLALRAALLQQGWMVVGFFLAIGAIFHIIEIWQWLRMARST